MTPADRLYLTYCAKDCAVTHECNDVMQPLLKPGQNRHYALNMALFPAVRYMELRGIRYDHEAAARRLARVEHWIHVLQGMLNRAAGIRLPSNQTELVSAIKQAGLVLAKPRKRYEETITTTSKKGVVKTRIRKVSEPATVETLEDCDLYCKDSSRAALDEIRVAAHALSMVGPQGRNLAARFSLDKSRAALAGALNLSVNVNATNAGGSAQTCLYETLWVPRSWRKGEGWVADWQAPSDEIASWPLVRWCETRNLADEDAPPFTPDHARMQLPRQYKKEGGRVTTKLTTDDEALIKLWVKTKDRRVLLFLRLRQLHTATETLRATCDPDGRIRCGLSQTGTETARFACYKSMTGSGYNLQTVTSGMRRYFTADPGHLMAQADLRGSDGWTIASYCAALGDDTMLRDLRDGFNPAQAVTLIYERGPSANAIPRSDFIPLAQSVDKKGWLYFACKKAIWAICYGTGETTISNNILIDSYKLTGKPIFVDVPTCKRIKDAVFARYPGIPRFQDWMRRKMRDDGVLESSLGFTRVFHGWRDPQTRTGDAAKTHRDMLAHLPQVYTTGATKLALLRLWSDPDNRRPDGTLRCEPLLTVHDSLLTQFRIEDKEWAKAKHREWFNNTLRIANETLVIKFDGTVGTDWGMKDAEKI